MGADDHGATSAGSAGRDDRAGGAGRDGRDELEELRRRLDREDVRDAARALLEPGETLQVLGSVGEAFGDSGPIEQHEPVTLPTTPWLQRLWDAGTRTRLRKVVFFTALAPLMVWSALDSIGPATLPDRWIGGRTCHGPRGSTARSVQHALSVLGSGADTIAVSDRRLLLLRNARSDPPRFRLVSALPRDQVVAARHAPRGPQRRRLALTFADGSRIVLALPLFDAPSPARLVGALQGPAAGG